MLSGLIPSQPPPLQEQWLGGMLLIYSLHCWSPHIVSSSGSWEHSQPNPKILSAHQWARMLPILFRALVTLCPPFPSSELFNVTLGFPFPRLLLHPGTQRTFGFLWGEAFSHSPQEQSHASQPNSCRTAQPGTTVESRNYNNPYTVFEGWMCTQKILKDLLVTWLMKVRKVLLNVSVPPGNKAQLTSCRQTRKAV